MPLLLVIALVALTEMTPKALAEGKRGGALLALFCFLLATFVTLNASAFPSRIGRTVAPEAAPSVSVR